MNHSGVTARKITSDSVRKKGTSTLCHWMQESMLLLHFEMDR